MFIVGMRGNGKTYGAKKIAIKNAIEKGQEFIYLRRYDGEMKKARNSFFADISHEFPEYDFRINGDKAEYSSKFEDGEKKRKWHVMGYFIALSKAQSYKSVAYPKVHYIIFDEFIVNKGLIRYLPDEFIAFQDFYLTVDRYNDRVKVFFIANTVSINNPYFVEMKIRPDQMGEFTTQGAGYVAIHMIDSKDFKTHAYSSRFGRFIESSRYADYAVEAGFKDAHTELVDIKPPTARYKWTFDVGVGMFSVWADMVAGVVYIQEKRPATEIIFTTLRENVTKDITYLERNNKILQFLRAHFNNGKMYFDKPSTRNIFIEVFK